MAGDHHGAPVQNPDQTPPVEGDFKDEALPAGQKLGWLAAIPWRRIEAVPGLDRNADRRRVRVLVTEPGNKAGGRIPSPPTILYAFQHRYDPERRRRRGYFNMEPDPRFYTELDTLRL